MEVFFGMLVLSFLTGTMFSKRPLHVHYVGIGIMVLGMTFFYFFFRKL